LPVWQPADADWNWNSRYWRTLGAPWGGLISTASDLGRLARMLLQGGRTSDGRRILSNSAISAAMTNQTEPMTELPESVRRHQRWGLGWRLNWPHHAAAFGDLVPSDTVGHWGATGTLMWLSPAMRQYAVLLTTDPYEHSLLAIQKLSNIICSWFSDSEV
jgi:CubicO group peptidase (beta-lactamase class C family)